MRALGLILCSSLSFGASFQAGFSRIEIGSGGWAQALAISGSKNDRVVIVATNLGALTRSITDPASAQLANDYELTRSQILFSSTHVGPGEIADPESVIRNFSTVAAAALGNLAPARIYYGSGRLHAGETTLDLTGCESSAQSMALMPVGGAPHGCGPRSLAVRAIDGPIRAAFEMTELEFAPNFDDNRPVRRVPYPVQAIRFGTIVTIVALGGGVSTDYAIRARRQFSGELILVAASNDAAGAGPFGSDVQDRIFAAIGRVLERVGYKAR